MLQERPCLKPDVDKSYFCAKFLALKLHVLAKDLLSSLQQSFLKGSAPHLKTRAEIKNFILIWSLVKNGKSQDS